MHVLSTLAFAGLATATTVNIPGGAPLHAVTGDTYFGSGSQVTVTSKDWAAWSAWSACSKTCGGGTSAKLRSCKSTSVKHAAAPKCWVGPTGATVVHFTRSLHPSFKCHHVSATKCACVIKADGCRQFDSKSSGKTFHITSGAACDSSHLPTDNCIGAASQTVACNAQPCIDYAELATKTNERNAKSEAAAKTNERVTKGEKATKDDAERNAKGEASAKAEKVQKNDAERTGKAEAQSKAFERKQKADNNETQAKADAEKSGKAEAQSKALERAQKNDGERASKAEASAKATAERNGKAERSTKEASAKSEASTKEASAKGSAEASAKNEASAKATAEKNIKVETIMKEHAIKAAAEKSTKEHAAKNPPIDGWWTGYVKMPCSKTCGGGVQQRIRSCTSTGTASGAPAPQNGGRACLGDAILGGPGTTFGCNFMPCTTTAAPTLAAPPTYRNPFPCVQHQGRITILAAKYGGGGLSYPVRAGGLNFPRACSTSSGSCDATSWLGSRCNGRSSCSFSVSNAMCGDPWNRCPKWLGHNGGINIKCNPSAINMYEPAIGIFTPTAVPGAINCDCKGAPWGTSVLSSAPYYQNYAPAGGLGSLDWSWNGHWKKVHFNHGSNAVPSQFQQCPTRAGTSNPCV